MTLQDRGARQYDAVLSVKRTIEMLLTALTKGFLNPVNRVKVSMTDRSKSRKHIE